MISIAQTEELLKASLEAELQGVMENDQFAVEHAQDLERAAEELLRAEQELADADDAGV